MLGKMGKGIAGNMCHFWRRWLESDDVKVYKCLSYIVGAWQDAGVFGVNEQGGSEHGSGLIVC